jgi:hypothetical protein
MRPVGRAAAAPGPFPCFYGQSLSKGTAKRSKNMPDSESDSKSELIRGAVEVVKTAYDDALKPVAGETGKALGTIGRTVNVALAPLRGLVWSWDRIESWLTTTVERKLQERAVPLERISTPNPDVAVPAIEALRYTRLREQFANLLATAMDTKTADEAHPSFVEILKQITPEEAKILQFLPHLGRYEPLMDFHFSLPEKGEFLLYRHASTIAADVGCQAEDSVPPAIDNLCRLGLTEIPGMRHLVEHSRYDRIRNSPLSSATKERVPPDGEFIMKEKMLGVTSMGHVFREVCIYDRKKA